MNEIKKTKKLGVEVFFWLILIAYIVPISIYFHQKNLFSKTILSHSFEGGWKVYSSSFSIDDFSIPKDLKKIKDFDQADEVFYEKKIGKEIFSEFKNPALVIGRIGDAADIFVNDCLLHIENFDQNQGWWWGALRYVSVPSSCLAENNLVKVKVKHWGFANKGIYEGPIGIGEYQFVKTKAQTIEFFKYGIFFVFGMILLVSVFAYYLFIYFLVPERKYNLLFSLFAMFTGIYEICVSTVPYRYLGGGELGLKLNFLSALAASIFLFEFYNSKFSILKSKVIIRVLYISFVCLLLIGLFQNTINSIFQYYQTWFTIFLLAITIFTVKFVQKFLKSSVQDEWRYLVGLIIFLITLYADIISSAVHKTDIYLIPYGFILLMLIASQTLAKEAADAFLYVEAQVGERTKDLSSALEQLKGLEKMKERFFANVSHDLKTPITIALGAIEETKNQFRSTIGRVLEPADRSLRRLQDMVMSILDTVKAESGTLTLEWKSVKVAAFLSNILDAYQPLCAKEGITLKFSGEGYQGLSVPMDASKIERVLENLLSNAIKFTKKTPRTQKVIEISIKTDQSKVYIHIDDSGIGIPENERQKVFERYFQSSRTSLREHGGSGIGLSFVSEMIELHNGRVYAEESPFQGSRFTIELPLSQNIENIQSYRIEDTAEKNLRGSLDVEYPPTSPEKINTSRMTLLVAEDNPEVAQIVYSTLKDHYNVYFGENGKRALELLGERSFDCILSDIEMPVMTGDEFVENARKETKWKSIPIIMLSSHGDEDTIVKLLKLGANDYVQKPFRREILLSRIQAQISAYKGTTWNTKMEKLQELGQLVSGIGHQGKNRIGRVGSNYPLLIKIAKDLAKKLEATRPDEAYKINEKIDAVGGLIDKGYKQTVDLFKAIDRYASGSENKTVISIEEVVGDTVTLLEEKIRVKGITVEVGDLKNLSFEGYNEFREAILNIISNAVDAVEANKGKIVIRGESTAKEIFITIVDNGHGIAKENITHVFEPFFTSKQVGQGTGLGLYLARDAIELKNQGKLTITSPGKDQGATVQITVPKVVSEIKQDRPTMHNVGV